MADRIFPFLHIRPARGWLNDPNGLCRIDGRYHVFFQHNPDAPVHDAICWGHVSSTDLVGWTEHPVALRPQPGGQDEAGCWSGCVVDDDGVPTAVYTAVPDHAEQAVVALARSDRRLEHWQRDPRPGPGRPEDASVGEVRDPFVFTVDGHRYAVQGAGRHRGSPRLLLWGCDDLRAWVPLGSLLDDTDPVAAAVAPADIWECPNLVQVDGRWVLLLSLWRWADGTHALVGVRFLVGDLRSVGAGLRFVPETGGVLDEGPAFYAPQALTDGDRVLLWGWARELDRTPAEVAAAGWAGVLTHPRVLGLGTGRDGRPVVTSCPAPELDALRGGPVTEPVGTPFTHPAFEVLATGAVRLELAGVTVLETVGRADAPARVLVDGSLVESFTAGVSWTGRAYPAGTDAWRVVGDPGQIAVHHSGRAVDRRGRDR